MLYLNIRLLNNYTFFQKSDQRENPTANLVYIHYMAKKVNNNTNVFPIKYRLDILGKIAHI